MNCPTSQTGMKKVDLIKTLRTIHENPCSIYFETLVKKVKNCDLFFFLAYTPIYGIFSLRVPANIDI